MRASHLVWGTPEAIPLWLRQGAYSRQDYIHILETHVRTVMQHFRGRVTEWSIANEAVGRSRNPADADFWADRIGPEYVEMAFRWADATAPESVLIFNEDNNEVPRDAETRWRIDTMWSMVQAMRAQGIGVDVVGMQGHLLLPWNSAVLPDEAEIAATMRRFASLGVKVHITEMDVDLHGRPGTQADRWAFQAALYGRMVRACLASQVCTGYTTWGVSDKDSWITCGNSDWGCIDHPDGDPLLLDRKYRPKPAYFAVQAALSGDWTAREIEGKQRAGRQGRGTVR